LFFMIGIPTVFSRYFPKKIIGVLGAIYFGLCYGMTLDHMIDARGKEVWAVIIATLIASFGGFVLGKKLHEISESINSTPWKLILLFKDIFLWLCAIFAITNYVGTGYVFSHELYHNIFFLVDYPSAYTAITLSLVITIFSSIPAIIIKYLEKLSKSAPLIVMMIILVSCVFLNRSILIICEADVNVGMINTVLAVLCVVLGASNMLTIVRFIFQKKSKLMKA